MSSDESSLAYQNLISMLEEVVDRVFDTMAEKEGVPLAGTSKKSLRKAALRVLGPTLCLALRETLPDSSSLDSQELDGLPQDVLTGSKELIRRECGHLFGEFNSRGTLVFPLWQRGSYQNVIAFARVIKDVLRARKSLLGQDEPFAPRDAVSWLRSVAAQELEDVSFEHSSYSYVLPLHGTEETDLHGAYWPLDRLIRMDPTAHGRLAELAQATEIIGPHVGGFSAAVWLILAGVWGGLGARTFSRIGGQTEELPADCLADRPGVVLRISQFDFSPDEVADMYRLARQRILGVSGKGRRLTRESELLIYLAIETQLWLTKKPLRKHEPRRSEGALLVSVSDRVPRGYYRAVLDAWNRMAPRWCDVFPEFKFAVDRYRTAEQVRETIRSAKQKLSGLPLGAWTLPARRTMTALGWID